MPLEEALTKYSQYTHLITASRYILPFNVVSEREVKKAFCVEGELQVYSKTPNIGGFWSTHPTFRYALDEAHFFDRNTIFTKVSTERNTLVEMQNLIKMGEGVRVPKMIGFFKNASEDVEELRELKPGASVGAVLVEEFVDSISLGQALIEENIDIDALVAGVFSTLRQLHRFCAHRDLKHSHIRVCLDPIVAENLVFGRKERIEELRVNDITIIDVETALFFSSDAPQGFQCEEDAECPGNLDEDAIRRDLHMDMVQLISSLTSYMSVLEPDFDIIRRFFPMPVGERIRRFGMILDKLSEQYDIAVPLHLVPNSQTGRYLIDWIKAHGR